MIHLIVKYLKHAIALAGDAFELLQRNLVKKIFLEQD